MADTEGKKLTELRVIDLKTELERRGLDKTGNKAALLERLSKAISDEGENPEEFLIVPCVGLNKICPQFGSSRRTETGTGIASQDESMESHDSLKEESSENQENIETKSKEDQPSNAPADEIASIKKREPQIILQDAMKKVPKVQDTKVDTSEKVNNENNDEAKESEKKNEAEASASGEPSQPAVPPTPAQPAAPVTPEPTPATNASVEANGIDNEDSINLTIGEDEENLLAEETETHVRQKDGGAKKRIEDNKKGDSKGSGRADGSSGGNKDGNSSSSTNAGSKSKQDGGDGGKSVVSINKGQKRDDKEKKTTQSSPANASSRNLWVSGLSSTTRATDLKQIFSKYGKVIGAKVVTNARTPGARCYGYVTMSTSEDAAKCIQHLHRTELHGRVISVEKAKGDSQQSHMRKRESNNGKSEKKDDKDKVKDGHELLDKKDKDPKKDVEDKNLESVKKIDDKGDATEEKKIEASEKKDDATKDADTRSTKSTSKKPESERGKREDNKRIRTWDHHRSHSRSRSRERRRRDDEERERQRLRQREWMLREEERRRREDVERQREIERRQRDEAARLEREREKLRREREKIEQEKAELLRLERERQKLEREKLERERLELKRQQMRLEESRRAPPPPSIKRTSSDRRDPRDLYVEPERKRITTEHSRRHSPDRVADRRPEILDRVSDRRLDPSPPSRYESTSRSTQDLALKKDFKRGTEFTSRSSSRPEAFPEVSRGREVIVRREPLPPPSSSIDSRQVKERYERPTTTTYGREREVRRSEPESHRSTRDSHTRYSESSKPPGSSAPRDSRYGESNRAPSGWHSGPPSTKSFNSVPSGGPRDPRNEPPTWSSRSSDNANRWSNSSSMGSTLRHPGPPLYQGGPIQSIGLTAPGTAPSYDRFDPYKSSIPSMRKF